MLRNNVKSAPEVQKFIQEYYYAPERLVSKVLGESPPKPIT